MKRSESMKHSQYCQQKVIHMARRQQLMFRERNTRLEKNKESVDEFAVTLDNGC